MKKIIKTYMVVLPLSATVLLTSIPTGASAQFIVGSVITSAIKKVIKAIDLKVQRLQNQTIWLQNAQKVIENTLSKLKLDEISNWTEKQRKLYADYYDKLVKVKALISTYQEVREIAGTQAAIMQEYRWASGLFHADKHFSAAELTHMEGIYQGILDQSLKNVDQLFNVINSFKTQMSDAARLELIHASGKAIEQNYSDLKRFNDQNITLSIQRARSALEVKHLKELYEVN